MRQNRPHPHLTALPPVQNKTAPVEYSRDSTARAVVVRVVRPEQEAAIVAPRSFKATLRLYLSIMKPITWVPVVWSFWCGAVEAGGLNWQPLTLLQLLVGLVLSGPLLCGMSQAINDYFDREVDAVNEPWRAIASGQLSLLDVFRVIAGLGFVGLIAAYFLGEPVLILSLTGIVLAHLYSGPPLRLKAVTWLGPLTSSISYIVLPWLAAASIFGGITWDTLALAGIFAVGGMGIMISNDFKSIRGDYALKLPSVPVVYGTKPAARIICALIDLSQLAVIGLLLCEGRWQAAIIVGGLLLPQLWLQKTFVQKPLALAVWYNARSQNFFVLAMLIAAWLI